jgi:GT2 family glycosyltransferase
VIVTYESLADIERALPPLVSQLAPADELIVVDNASTDGTADRVAELAPGAKVIRSAENLGFAGGCNRGAQDASGDVLLLLNPDTEVAPGFADAIRGGAGDWDAWMGLATRGGGELVNTAGNLVHFTGFSWAGGDGAPASSVPDRPAAVRCLSGVCLAIPRSRWEELGGFPAEWFSYVEDTDLSMRLRLAGARIGIEPAARVEHLYSFSKPSTTKWRNLERNRWAMIWRTYPGPLLALVFPALLLTELALIGISIAGGWAGAKLRANADVLRWLPRLLRERREIQSRREISAGEFASGLVPELGSEYFGSAARLRPLRWGLRAYWRVVLALLGSSARRSS